MTAPVRSAAIIGLGLIGGSLARDLAALGTRVVGHDRDPARIRAAREAGVVVATAAPDERPGLEEAEMVVLAVPVSDAPVVLEQIAPALASARLITDVGSTKRAIGRAAERLRLGERFVGAHPLAGDHRSGWEASRPGLFRDAPVYLTPTPRTSPETLALARRLWEAVGARPELLDPAAHDARLAWTSHLPQAASSALALALGDGGHRRGELGPGGRDVTRLALSDAAMWSAVAAENSDELGPALRALEARLAELRAAAERGDLAELRRLFEAARAWGDAG